MKFKVFRDWLQQTIYKIINPIVHGMIKIGITPNFITTTGLILNIVAACIFLYAGMKRSRYRPTMNTCSGRNPIHTAVSKRNSAVRPITVPVSFFDGSTIVSFIRYFCCSIVYDNGSGARMP